MDEPIEILAIDDNPYAMRLIREVLSDVPRLKFRMDQQQRLSDGLTALASQQFDIILLDLTLPDSVGLETFNTMQAEAPQTPIVILTNADDDRLALEAVRKGAQDYLVKNDMDGRILARSINYAIERHHATLEVQKLQEEVTNLTVREQRRIGQELHDGLGQHLTGVGLMAKSLQSRLEAESSPAAADAAELSELITEAKRQVGAVVRGLHPVDVDAEGLTIALSNLANNITRQCNVNCTFDSAERAHIADNQVATYLYHIAQEAVNNAVKYAEASHIAIRLDPEGKRVQLSVSDNGKGLPVENAAAEQATEDGQDGGGIHRGLGLKIMQYRASVIGAHLEINSSPGSGVTVVCQLSTDAGDDQAG